MFFFGVFYSKTACDTNTYIRPAHPDQCLKDEDTDGEDNDERSNLLQPEDTPISLASVDHNLDYSDEDECHLKDYDLMKEKVLNKSIQSTPYF